MVKKPIVVSKDTKNASEYIKIIVKTNIFENL